jgi:hypothetical protein
MTQVERLAEFAVRASYDDLSEAARDQLKIRVLDSLGCAIGAMGAEPVQLVHDEVAEFGPSGACTLIGGGRTAPDRAAFYNGALVRYLDYNDGYLAKGESCHPSDNLSAVLAACEYADRSGRDLMVALAVAYQVQCRLSDEAPVRAAGFDHTTQGSYAVAAGVSRALGLDVAHTANALAISGTAFNALRVTRTGALSHWKGLAYPNTAARCVWATFLARRGITGPLGVFEGNKGFMEAIAGPFTIDWSSEDLERVTRTVIKRHNAEIHAQTAIDAALELKRQHRFVAGDVDRIDVEVFDVAFVGDEDDWLVHAAQPLGHFVIERHPARADIDDEHDDARFLDGPIDLPLDVLGQVVAVFDAHAAGINQLNVAIAQWQGNGNAVTRHARGRVDDGNPLADNAVEKAALADVRASDDGDNRQTHKSFLPAKRGFGNFVERRLAAGDGARRPIGDQKELTPGHCFIV